MERRKKKDVYYHGHKSPNKKTYKLDNFGITQKLAFLEIGLLIGEGVGHDRACASFAYLMRLGKVEHYCASKNKVFEDFALGRLSLFYCSRLAIIFNTSISSGTFPDKLKTSKITPIFKAGEDNDPDNYRAISILLVFHRIFEKFIV